MSSYRTPLFVLALLYLVFFGLLVWSKNQLPAQVATHFNAAGRADGWMSSAQHLRFMILFGLGFPWFVPVLCYFGRFLPPWCWNLPHKDLWLAPELRPILFRYLLRHSLWFACFALGFVIGIGWSIVQANQPSQPRLSPSVAFAVIGPFLLATLLWAVRLLRFLNRVPKPQLWIP